MLYYGLLGVFYLLVITSPYLLHPTVYLVTFIASTLAFFFSLYLIFVMWRILKAWCFWCVTSATLSTREFQN